MRVACQVLVSSFLCLAVSDLASHGASAAPSPQGPIPRNSGAMRVVPPPAPPSEPSEQATDSSPVSPEISDTPPSTPPVAPTAQAPDSAAPGARRVRTPPPGPPAVSTAQAPDSPAPGDKVVQTPPPPRTPPAARPAPPGPPGPPNPRAAQARRVLNSGAELARPLPEGFVGRTLKVGAGEQFQNPSEAAQDARPGDTIEIAAGTYTDCAVWPQGASPLTITGNGKVVVAEKTCGGKAIWVIRGADVTVRGITFTGAKVRDHNGAGIRGEGLNLTVENSRFVGNEEGILAGVRGGTVTIRDSYFERNGTCIAACAHGVYIGQKIEKLHIENSHFINQRVGHHIKSRALTTELINNVIEDGPEGNASFLVDLPNGGTLIMRGNTLEKGPHSQNRTTTIAIGEEHRDNPSDQILIENNKFTNDANGETAFVRNFGTDPVTLRNNQIKGPVTPLQEMAPKKP